MGFTVRFMLGTILVLLCCWSIETTRLIPQTSDGESKPTEKLQKIEEERTIQQSIVANLSEESDKPKTDFSTESNKTLDKQSSLIGKLQKAETYKKAASQPDVKNLREDISRSIDIDKYVSKDFHNKNNVYTLPMSPDTAKYVDDDYNFHSNPPHNRDHNEEFTFELTTPKTSFFDDKFKKTVESVEQKLEHGDDSHELALDVDTSNDSLNLKKLYDEIKNNGSKANFHYINYKNIISNDTAGKNSIHKDLVVEAGTNLAFHSFYNETKRDDHDDGNNTIIKEPAKEKIHDTEAIPDQEKSESSTLKSILVTTKKSLVTKPPSNRNSSHISILSNNIETETIKAINSAQLNAYTTTNKPKIREENEEYGSSTATSITKRDPTKLTDNIGTTQPTERVNEITKKSEQLFQENQVIPIHVEAPSTTEDPNGKSEIPTITTVRESTTDKSHTTENLVTSTETATSEVETKSVILTQTAEEATVTTTRQEESATLPTSPSATTLSTITTTTTTTRSTTESATPTSSTIQAAATTSSTTEATTTRSTTEAATTISTTEAAAARSTTEVPTTSSTTPAAATTTSSTTTPAATTTSSTTPAAATITSSTTEATTRSTTKAAATTRSTTEAATTRSTTEAATTSSTTPAAAAATTSTNEIEATNIITLPVSTVEISTQTDPDDVLDVTSSTVVSNSDLTATEFFLTTTESPTTLFEEDLLTTLKTDYRDETTSTEDLATVTASTDSFDKDFPTTTETALKLDSDSDFDKNDNITTEKSIRTSKAIDFRETVPTTEPMSTTTELPATTEFMKPTTEEVKILETTQPKKEPVTATTEPNSVVTESHTFVPKVRHEINDSSESETTTEINTVSSDSDELNTISPDDGSGTVAAITISSIGAVCLVLLAGIFVFMRKRQKRFNYRQRCTPVSLNEYNVDNTSVYNSVRRKVGIRDSKTSYTNQGYEDASVSHPLNFQALGKFATNLDDMKAEFGEIPQITAKTNELPEGCDVKNRYANVIPLPETRVNLTFIDGYPNSNYINANYVTGPNNIRKYYIACQAPIQSTVDDFWRMVWEQQSKVILMLTHLFENGVEKCVDYLPPSEVLDCHRAFGDFLVTLKKREVKDKYIISILQLKNMVSSSWREVTHFWYLGWPEKGVPSEANSLIAFLIEARSYMKSSSIDRRDVTNGNLTNGTARNELNPVIVHCSPGTGRTGVVIACDIAIREFEQTRLVDVPRIVYKIRRERASSVQTKEQYAFIYKVVSLYATKLTGGALDSL